MATISANTPTPGPASARSAAAQSAWAVFSYSSAKYPCAGPNRGFFSSACRNNRNAAFGSSAANRDRANNVNASAPPAGSFPNSTCEYSVSATPNPRHATGFFGCIPARISNCRIASG